MLLPDKRISVIIPSYNCAATIAACLNSLAAQRPPRDFEVIVVDSSRDETPDIVRRRFPWVRLIHLPEKTDQGSARNLGIEEAQGEILFFIDADCLAPPDWIEGLLAAHAGGYPVAGGPIVNANPESAISWAGYLLEFNNLLPDGQAREVRHLPSGNVSYRRDVLRRLGGFPAGLSYYLEDLLFHCRMAESGIRMWFDPALAVAHFHRTRLGDYLRHQYVYGRGTVQLLRQTKLRGAWLARHPAWALPLVPLLPLVKFVRTSWIFLRWNPGQFFKKPLVFPLMALGLVYWFGGVAIEMYKKDE